MAQSHGTTDDILNLACAKLGLNQFKDEQKRALDSFLKGHDVFISLPTGFGKSVVFQAAPICCDIGKAGEDDDHSFALVVMPIKALIKDQLDRCTRLHIGAKDISGGYDDSFLESLFSGQVSLLFTSPEFLTGESGRAFLRLQYVQDHLCGLFIDESHCVLKWGQSSGKTQAFRSSYGDLAELRSTLPCVPVVAMTATASSDVRIKVAQGLAMKNYVMISKSPDQPNIKHVVLTMASRDFDRAFRFLVEELKVKGPQTERTILYCQSRKLVAELYAMFASETPKSCAPYFDMYHTNTESNVQERIIEDFANSDGSIRVLIATIAFGMGIDVKGTHTAIMVGRPSDLDDYLQMSGRIGRDGKRSTSIIVKYPGDTVGRTVSSAMTRYIKGNECRRRIILESFVSSLSTMPVKHDCCDVCTPQCKCAGNSCDAQTPRSEAMARQALKHEASAQELPILIPTSSQLRKLQSSLEDYRDSLVSSNPDHLYSGKDLASGLSEATVKQIVQESTVQLTKAEYFRRYRFPSPEVAEKTWNLYLIALEREDLMEEYNAKDTNSQCDSDESDLWSGDEFADAVLDRSQSDSG